MLRADDRLVAGAEKNNRTGLARTDNRIDDKKIAAAKRDVARQEAVEHRAAQIVDNTGLEPGIRGRHPRHRRIEEHLDIEGAAYRRRKDRREPVVEAEDNLAITGRRRKDKPPTR